MKRLLAFQFLSVLALCLVGRTGRGESSESSEAPAAQPSRKEIAIICTAYQQQYHGDGKDDLSMCDGRADFFGNVLRGQQRPLLVAGGTRAALLAGEGDEHLVLAVGAANSGETFLQIATLEIGCHRLFDDRPPETVLGLITLVVDLLEGVKVLVEQPPKAGGLGIAWAVERQGLDTGGGHGGKDG